MTIGELRDRLLEYDDDIEVFIAFGDSDGVDFEIEEGEFAVFLVNDNMFYDD